LRTRAGGWDATQAERTVPPTPQDYVLNPYGAAPEFTLSEGRYISSEQLNAALESGRRLVLLDTRVPYFWAMANIRGSVPLPYYSDFDEVVGNLPTDGTWIVAYCECPRAAADSVVTRLRERGFANTAVLHEGYAGWTALGYPVVAGEVPVIEE
jgi:rhodanese-related sulfurtransferase